MSEQFWGKHVTDALGGMIDALELQRLVPESEGDEFQGPSQWMPHGRVYGGQVLAQALVAALRTVDDERLLHSTHGYFLRPGDINLPIAFQVDRIHDGRSFSTRRSQAFQHGLPILSLIASFQISDDGLEHQLDMPGDIPPPESLPSDEELLSDIDHPIARHWASGRPFDMRHVDPDIFLQHRGELMARQAVWFRARGRMPDDPQLHRAALAYASDYTILESVLRRHGVPWAQRGLKVASLDHAMWWHRFARVDDWLLYVQESPNAIGGRGLAQGRIYTRDGMLVASVAQEGMIRVP